MALNHKPKMDSMRFFTFLLVALLAFTLVPMDARAQKAVNIDVPVLTKSVVLDGQVTYPDEWADTNAAKVIFPPILYPEANSPFYLDMSVLAKHDARWLYLLFKTTIPTDNNYQPRITASVAYFWGAKVGGNYEQSDMGTVNGTSTDDFFGMKDGTWKRDTDYGGQNNVEGTVGLDSLSGAGFTAYTFEFRKALDSGDGFDWVLSTGLTYYMQIQLSSVTMNWHSAKYQGSFSQSITFTVLDRLLTTSAVSSTSLVTQTSEMQGLSIGIAGSTLSMVGLVAAVASVSSILILTKRRKIFSLATTFKDRRSRAGSMTKSGVSILQPIISTGYRELDHLLKGGVPESYAVLIVSQSYDERDLLIRKMVGSTIDSGRQTFYMSNDIARAGDLTTRFDQNFYALSPVADRIGSARPNLFKVPDVGDLSNLNISSNQIIESKSNGTKSKMIVIDLLSDVLLRNKAITTRRWLSDFVGKRKAAGFTVLATLDPSIAPKEDVQAIVGVFDGVIEIFEKELQERSRRFLVIKKMYGREYSDNELMLDRAALL